MKIQHLLLVPVFLLLLSGCKKYEEGPSLSLISKKERVANAWKLESYFENGVDKTSDAQTLFKDFLLVIDKNNMKYAKSFSALGLLPYGESGSWKFSSDKSSIEFTPDNTNISPYSWKIVKLKESSSGFSYTSNNVNYKLYLKP